jgi:hypothetical protein
MRDGGDNLKDAGPRLSEKDDWRIGTDYIHCEYGLILLSG